MLSGKLSSKTFKTRMNAMTLGNSISKMQTKFALFKIQRHLKLINQIFIPFRQKYPPLPKSVWPMQRSHPTTILLQQLTTSCPRICKFSVNFD